MAWSESQWRVLVDLFESSGLQRAAFCVRERITVHALDKWRARLGRTQAKRKVLAARGLMPIVIKGLDHGPLVRVTVVLEHRALKLEGSAADLTQLLRCL